MKTNLFILSSAAVLCSCINLRTGTVSSSGHLPSDSKKRLLGVVEGHASVVTVLGLGKSEKSFLISKAKQNLLDKISLDSGQYLANFTTDIHNSALMWLGGKTKVKVTAEVYGEAGQLVVYKLGPAKIEEVVEAPPTGKDLEKHLVPKPDYNWGNLKTFLIKTEKVSPCKVIESSGNKLKVVLSNANEHPKWVSKNRVLVMCSEKTESFEFCQKEVRLSASDGMMKGVVKGLNDKFFLIETQEKTPRRLIRSRKQIETL